MSNTLLTISQITRKAAMILHQKANFIGSMNRGYDDSFAESGAKIGDTLRIRLPNEYQVRTGWNMGAQNTVEQKVDLVVNNVKGVDLNFTSKDLALDLDDFSDRILDPAMSVLAANIEADVYNGLYPQVWNLVDGDTQAFSEAHPSKAREILTDSLAPLSKRRAILQTKHTTKFLNATKNLPEAAGAIANQYLEGAIKRFAAADFYENTVFHDHVTGTALKTTTYTVDAINGDGETLTLTGASTTFLKGDVITIADWNAVHPETKQDLGYARQFVVKEGGTTSIKVSPKIVTTGGRQNVTAAATGKAVTKVGAGANELLNGSLMFHRDAFTFATADLPMPKGTDMASRAVIDGISVSIVRDFSISDRQFPCRLDVLYGYAAIRPQLATRIHADGGT